jgi:hypothetical protein
VDIARAVESVVVLLVMVLLLMLLLLLLLLLLSDLTVRDRRNGSEPMRRVHCGKAAAAWCKWSIEEALLFRRAEMNQIVEVHMRWSHLSL